MSRLTFLAVLFGGAVAVAVTQSAAPPQARPPAAAPAALLAPAVLAPPASPALTSRAGELIRSLNNVVAFSGLDDTKVTFQEALDQREKIHNVSFRINERAFKAAGMSAEVLYKTEIANPPLPPRRARLSHVLQILLDRLPSSSPAVFMVREDHIEITTRDAQNLEVSAERDEVAPAPRRPAGGPAMPGGGLGGVSVESDEMPKKILVPLVSVALKNQSFAEAVAQIRAQTNVNVVLDPSLAEKAQAPLTLILLNTPLDTAALVLTELADLDFVWLDNVFFVTTREKAARLRPRWPNRRGGSTVLPGTAENPGGA